MQGFWLQVFSTLYTPSLQIYTNKAMSRQLIHEYVIAIEWEKEI